MSQVATLVPSDRNNIVNFIEGEYLVKGSVPTTASISEAVFLDSDTVERHLKSKELIAMLARRGIDLHSNGLTPEMLAVANVMLDFGDRRSKTEKLKSLGVTTQQYNGFVKNRHFNEYVTKRAEQLLPDSMHEAHTALLKNVERGEVQSLKLFYEMTGRHIPTSQTNGLNGANVETIVNQIFDIIVRRVKDPEALRAISDDLGSLVGNLRPTNGGAVISGIIEPPVAALESNAGREILIDL